MEISLKTVADFVAKDLVCGGCAGHHGACVRRSIPSGAGRDNGVEGHWLGEKPVAFGGRVVTWDPCDLDAVGEWLRLKCQLRRYVCRDAATRNKHG